MQHNQWTMADEERAERAAMLEMLRSDPADTTEAKLKISLAINVVLAVVVLAILM